MKINKEMNEKDFEYLKVCFPRWFIIYFTFCVIGSILIFIIYTSIVIYQGRFESSIFGILFFLLILLIGFWIFSKFLFYCVIATDKGLKVNNIFEKSKSILWEEIIEVQRPRFGIPADIAYVILKNKNKLLLIRSMINYKKLIKLIKKRASNLQKCKS